MEKIDRYIPNTNWTFYSGRIPQHLVCGLLLACLLLTSGCNSKDEEDSAETEPKRSLGSTLTSEPPPSNPEHQTRPTLPPDLEEEIEKIVAGYSGNKLRDKLIELGAAVVDSGDVDAYLEFLKVLPPGEIADRAFNDSAHRLFSKSPNLLLDRFDEFQSALPRMHLLNALSTTATAYTNRGEHQAMLATVFADERLSELHKSEFARGILFTLSGTNPPEAISIIKQLPEGSRKDRLLSRSLQGKTLEFVALDQTEELGSLISSVSAKAQESFVGNLASYLANDHPEEALTSVAEQIPEHLRGSFSENIFEEWVTRNVNPALDWLGNQPESANRDRLIFTSINVVASWNAEAGQQWAESISDETLRSRALDSVNDVRAARQKKD